MDQILDRRPRFDRFTLDLARATLLIGGDEITLRPKVFEVLRHLVEHAGSLVSKQQLHDAVWPDVAVTDDSLVQCIRELRQVLGDDDHRLIKTVSRRGYLLDAAPRATATDFPAGESAEAEMRESRAGWRMRRPTGAWTRSVLLVAVVLPCVALGAILLPAPTTHPPVSLDFRPARLPASALNRLFTERDARRVADIAQGKQLPLPPIEFDTPSDDVPTAVRRFVGIWVSDKGFVNTSRQFMFVVTHVEKSGVVGGWTVRGPPAPNSRINNPAAAVAFTAFVLDSVLAYRNPRGEYKVWFTAEGGLVFRQTYTTGDMTMVALDPLWTLIEAERVARQSAAR